MAGRYRSPHEAAPVTLKLHPYRLVLIKHAWYLIARPDGQEHPRTYRTARFQTLKMLDCDARIPGDFDLKTYFGNAWGVYRGERSFDIDLRFTADAADVVVETVWHHTQRAKRHPGGEVTLSFTIDGLDEIVRWVLGWGSRVRVLQPDQLRVLVVEQHRKAIEANRAEN